MLSFSFYISINFGSLNFIESLIHLENKFFDDFGKRESSKFWKNMSDRFNFGGLDLLVGIQ